MVTNLKIYIHSSTVKPFRLVPELTRDHGLLQSSRHCHGPLLRLDIPDAMDRWYHGLVHDHSLRLHLWIR